MQTNRLVIWAGVAACTMLAGTESAQAAFTINLEFSPTTSAVQQQAFNNAKAYWESVIVGYKPNVNLTGITIAASVEFIDGTPATGNTLGNGRPTIGVTREGTVYATDGIMKFDSADYGTGAGATFSQVVLHEMAHALGFGTLWDDNGLYNAIANPGNYTGAAALARYRIEFGQPLATAVPVELDGGSGTMHAHWDENLNGSGATGIMDRFGRDKKNELMTGWVNAPTFVSQTTIAQFEDLGYVVVIPEPAGVGLLAPVGLLLRRRR